MNRTLVISIDALITADIPKLRALPNLGRVMKNAAYAKDILCVYPTLTYPCHTTIATGCYPDRHGIPNNERVQPLAVGRADWYWFRRDIRVPTLIDFTKANGLTTATITWPVMGDSGADYNIGEIWAPREEDDPTPWFRQANSPAAEDIFEKNKHLLRWMKTPQMDEFATQCAVDIIDRHQPDFMMLHWSYLDHQRHRLGVHSEELSRAFQFLDQQMEQVLEALERTGGVENTNIVLLGDHGQLPCEEMFHINSLFRDMGWLTQRDGVVTSYRVYAAQCGLSAQIYLQPDMDRQEVYQALLKMRKDYPRYIQRVFTKQEAADMRLRGEFDFVLEAGDGVTFSKLTDQTQAATPVSEMRAYKLSNANHGHLPEKGDKPPFIVSGPNAKSGKVLESGALVDEAPTILRMMGISPTGMDGTALDLVR